MAKFDYTAAISALGLAVQSANAFPVSSDAELVRRAKAFYEFLKNAPDVWEPIDG